VSVYFVLVILINQRIIAYGDTESTFVYENISKSYAAPLTIMFDAGHS
jgi:hypothetical protein